MTRARVLFCQWLATLMCAASTVSGEDGALILPVRRPATNSAVMEIRGRLALLPGGPRDEIGFKTAAGASYTLVSNRMSSALFVDTNLQAKTLLLKGHVWPGTQRFEVTGNLRSLRDGTIHEVYYYCDVCAIKGIDPGPCMCCREPVQLVEEPR